MEEERLWRAIALSEAQDRAARDAAAGQHDLDSDLLAVAVQARSWA